MLNILYFLITGFIWYFLLKLPNYFWILSLTWVLITTFIYWLQLKIPLLKQSAWVVLGSIVLWTGLSVWFLLFLDDWLLRIGFAIFVVCFAPLTLAISQQFTDPKSTKKHLLANFLNYLSLINFFLIASVLFFSKLILSWPDYLLILLFAVVLFCILAVSFWSYWSQGRLVWLYMLVIAILILELFMVVSLLPVLVFSAATILTLFFYALVGLSRHYLAHGVSELTTKVIARYLLISFSSLGIVFLTTWLN